jgi:hypothetical protein
VKRRLRHEALADRIVHQDAADFDVAGLGDAGGQAVEQDLIAAGVHSGQGDRLDAGQLVRPAPFFLQDVRFVDDRRRLIGDDSSRARSSWLKLPGWRATS